MGSKAKQQVPFFECSFPHHWYLLYIFVEGCVAGAKAPPCLSVCLIVSSKGINKKLVIPLSQCGNLIRSQQQREGGEAGISPLQEAGQRECGFLAPFLAQGGFGLFPA